MNLACFRMWPLCRRVKELQGDAAWAERMRSGRRMMGAEKGALNIRKCCSWRLLLTISACRFWVASTLRLLITTLTVLSRREGTEVPRNAAVCLHLYAPPRRFRGAHRRSWCVLLRLEWQTTQETSEVRPVTGRLCSHAAESERLS